MHVVGKMKTAVLNRAQQAALAATVPMKFYQKGDEWHKGCRAAPL
jgi:hypothetical protein